MMRIFEPNSALHQAKDNNDHRYTWTEEKKELAKEEEAKN